MRAREMQNVDQFTSASDPALKAAWIKGAIERLEKSVDKNVIREEFFLKKKL